MRSRPTRSETFPAGLRERALRSTPGGNRRGRSRARSRPGAGATPSSTSKPHQRRRRPAPARRPPGRGGAAGRRARGRSAPQPSRVTEPLDRAPGGAPSRGPSSPPHTAVASRNANGFSRATFRRNVTPPSAPAPWTRNVRLARSIQMMLASPVADLFLRVDVIRGVVGPAFDLRKAASAPPSRLAGRFRWEVTGPWPARRPWTEARAPRRDHAQPGSTPAGRDPRPPKLPAESGSARGLMTARADRSMKR